MRRTFVSPRLRSVPLRNHAVPSLILVSTLSAGMIFVLFPVAAGAVADDSAPTMTAVDRDRTMAQIPPVTMAKVPMASQSSAKARLRPNWRSSPRRRWLPMSKPISPRAISPTAGSASRQSHQRRTRGRKMRMRWQVPASVRFQGAENSEVLPWPSVAVRVTFGPVTLPLQAKSVTSAMTLPS
jgi:hypothetical protein